MGGWGWIPIHLLFSPLFFDPQFSTNLSSTISIYHLSLSKLPPTSDKYVWTEGHIPFRYFTGIGVYRKKP